MEEERKKREKEKQIRKEEHRKGEEARKKLEDEEKERRKAEATADAGKATTRIVSPPSDPKGDAEMTDPNINKNLFGIMSGEGQEEVREATRSPPSKKAQKATGDQTNATKPKHVVKSALKTGFQDTHNHNFQRILVEASIELKSENPEQEYIVSLQELMKNAQMVDKNFAFCPVKQDGTTKKIGGQSGIPTNMTMLSAYFKISANKGRNPFEKQKVWKNNKEVKGDAKNPIIYFSMAFATDVEPEDLLARISHE
jgi:hypothetical protein